MPTTKNKLAASLKSKVKTGAPHVIVEARAGTGKTTTLVEGLRLVRGEKSSLTPSPQQEAVWDAMTAGEKPNTICFVAFNKSIATELQERVPAGCSAMTMHSMGLKAVTAAFGRVKVSGWRVSDIISEITGKDIRELRKHQFEMLKATEKLVGLCKMNLVDGSDPEELARLAAHYDVDMNGSSLEVYDLVPRVLERCKDVAKDKKIDFDDMIWLPVALNLPVRRYDLLLVDECLPGWTPVMMGNGQSKEIKDVVIGDRVRSYDTRTGRAKNCSVSAVQKIPNRKPLVKVKVRHNHKTAGNLKSNFVVCTTDHKIWTINRGWVEAGSIQIGDSVIIETAAKTTQKGKITKSGRDNLSEIHVGNSKGTGNNGGQTAEDFNRIKGGNGRDLPTPQKLLLEALGDSWKPEYVVLTGDAPQFGRGVHPSSYKIDIANPEFKIAIELDGASHQGSEATDKKKDDFLTSMGWTVYRFKNREVARDFAGILQTVCPDGSSCPMPATVESVDDTYITEHYVYDITVEDCHNFYANGILVHNCQDLNRCQQSLALAAGKRLILCGDPKQAIYGFAGADAESMPRMEQTLSATPAGCVHLPLTVTRRCGKAIVREANRYVPDFSAFDGNGEGLVGSGVFDAEKGAYHDQVEDGDMLLCRVNAPLVSQCFKFLRQDRKAYIQGRDIGQGLISTIKKMKADSLPDLIGKLSDWYAAECLKENAKRNPSEAKLIALQDRKDCVEYFTDADGMRTVEDVIKKIESVFSDNSKAGIRLSSVHKAKGLEANRVFILQPKGATMPHPMAKSEWQVGQEYNLLYVAITRAIDELVYVS